MIEMLTNGSHNLKNKQMKEITVNNKIYIFLEVPDNALNDRWLIFKMKTSFTLTYIN